MEKLNLLKLFTNHCSNGKVTETKVVYLEKLNKNGIQKFSSEAKKKEKI